MYTLVKGALRVLSGKETAKEYDPDQGTNQETAK
jgi:butyrate kinase